MHFKFGSSISVRLTVTREQTNEHFQVIDIDLCIAIKPRRLGFKSL